MSSKILIADDTISVLYFLDLVFTRAGFSVSRAAYGEQAVQAALGEAPDVILLDVMMPGIDGLEVTRRLRADPRTTRLPILLYSAVVGDEIRAQARSAGADEFLGKTVNHGELVSKVRGWMAARSLPGGVGEAAFVAVGLDLLAVLETEWDWILGAGPDSVHHLAICCERGEQRALELLGVLGPGPFPLEDGTLWGEVAGKGEWRLNWPLGEVRRAPGVESVARAAEQTGALAVSFLPLRGVDGQRGALVYSPPPTLGQSRRGAQAVALAVRYAGAAISLWGDLPGARAPRAGPNAGSRSAPRG